MLPGIAHEPTSKERIQRVLDCGAGGIIVPLVNSREEAEKAVKAAKYPPEGIRGISLGRASENGNNFDNYFASINEEIVVIAQIEHFKAVEEIESIISVDGLYKAEDLDVEMFMDQYERLYSLYEDYSGEFIWSGAAFWGVPWMEAIAGCQVFADYETGSSRSLPPVCFRTAEDIPGLSADNP